MKKHLPITSSLRINPDLGNTSGKITSRTTFTCPKCQEDFEIKKAFQIFCSDECENYFNGVIKKVEDKNLNSTCSECGKPRRGAVYAGIGMCVDCEKSRLFKKRAYKRQEKNLNALVNPAKKRKGMSIEELNRRAEYKRVFDDKGWDHYLRGRKWDKV